MSTDVSKRLRLNHRGIGIDLEQHSFQISGWRMMQERESCGIVSASREERVDRDELSDQLLENIQFLAGHQLTSIDSHGTLGLILL